MPADGWWAVYGQADGTCLRTRLVGFALAEQWYSDWVSESAPSEDDAIERVVIPLGWCEGYIDQEDADNLLGIVHADEWPEMRAGFEQQAQARAVREQQRAAAAVDPHTGITTG